MSVKKEKSYPGIQIGASFLLVIFVTICQVLLGVLALSGALRDKGYSDRLAEKAGRYYEAVSAAQHKLGEIDQVIGGMEPTYKDYETYLENVGRVASEAEITCREDGQRLFLSYKEPITEEQSLLVEVEVLNPEKKEGNYKIVKWQEVSETVWEEEGTLPVLQFDEE